MHQNPESSCLQTPNTLEEVLGRGERSHTVPAHGNHWDGTGAHHGSTECRAIVVMLRLSSQQPSRCFIPGAQGTSERGETRVFSVRVGGERPWRPQPGARSRSDAGAAASSPCRRVRPSHRNKAGPAGEKMHEKGFQAQILTCIQAAVLSSARWGKGSLERNRWRGFITQSCR